MAEPIGVILMIIGLGFLTLAAIGVFRLPDAFQRMHAATKAGTLGASLVIMGAVLVESDVNLSTAIATMVFLLMTLPVSAQLLARAAYMSGATLRGLSRPDPLAKIVERHDSPLEERISALRGDGD